MYQSLYRRYRPQKFEDIVGQEKVVEILQNQIRKNMVGHAYLFTGVRGTGKTSIAKIFAKSLNCLDLQNGSPCNCCKNCQIIQEGNNIDIVEMDAASNNGVDDIRVIREEVNFLPTVLKYRVYIIDEVHMLSQGAFNALLKTLEEPPAHVKFILATTEPQKLPATILSRCQRFEFLRIPEEKIFNQLKYIAEDNNIVIEKDGLKLISNLANGSMRDGISILESVSNINGNITQEDVRKIIGIPDKKEIISVFKYILKGETEKVLKITNKILEEGKEPLGYITEILKVVQAIYLEEKSLLELYNQQEKEMLNELKQVDKLEIYKMINEILELISNIKYMDDKKIMLTLGIINIAEKNKVNPYFQNIQIGKTEQNIIENINANIKASINKNENNVEKEDKIEKYEKTNVIENSIDNQKEININNSNNNDNMNNNINIDNSINNSKEIKENIKDKIREELKEELKKEIELDIKREFEQEIINNHNNENIQKTELVKGIKPKDEKVEIKSRLIDVLNLRKKFLKQKETKLFVALSNVLIKTEGKFIKIYVGNEKDVNRLQTLNSLENVEKIRKLVSLEHGFEYEDIRYIINREDY